MNQERPSQLKKQEPGAVSNFAGNVTGTWDRLTRFLSDVRAEMKKVVVPSRKEVETTTAVVLITTFLFGLFFWVADRIFFSVVTEIMHRLGAQ